MSPSVALPRHWLPVLLVVVVHAALLALLRAPTVSTLPDAVLPPVVDVMMLPPTQAASASALAPAAAMPPARHPAPAASARVETPAPVAPARLPAAAPGPAPAPVAPAPDSLPAATNATPAPSVGGTGNGTVGGTGTAADAAVTPPRIDASYRGNRKPPYPAQSRRLGEEGVVELRFLVNADGSVGEIQLSRSSRFPRLDQSAIDTVRRWKLVPARRGGEAVAAWYSLQLKFELEN